MLKKRNFNFELFKNPKDIQMIQIRTFDDMFYRKCPSLSKILISSQTFLHVLGSENTEKKKLCCIKENYETFIY